MMLRHADRFRSHNIRVGDTLKMPLRLPPIFGVPDAPYRHGTFDVVAFPVYGSSEPAHRSDRPMAHCITIRRRADGWTTTIAAHHWIRVRGDC